MKITNLYNHFFLNYVNLKLKFTLKFFWLYGFIFGCKILFSNHLMADPINIFKDTTWSSDIDHTLSPTNTFNVSNSILTVQGISSKSTDIIIRSPSASGAAKIAFNNSTLSLNAGAFVHNANYSNSFTQLSGDVNFNAVNDSKLSLSRITDFDLTATMLTPSSVSTTLNINITNSALLLNQIEFKYNTSTIGAINIINDANKKPYYTSVFNGNPDQANTALQLTTMDRLNLQNANLQVKGSINITNLSNITLSNSDLNCDGYCTYIGQVKDIYLSEGSTFIADSRSSILDMQNGAVLDVNKSTFKVDKVSMKNWNGSVFTFATTSNATFNNIEIPKYTGTSANSNFIIRNTGNSTFNIKQLIFVDNHSADTQLKIISDSTGSTGVIGKLSVSDNNFTLDVQSANLDVGDINYTNVDRININNTSSVDYKLTIGNIDVKVKENSALLEPLNFNFNTTNLTVKDINVEYSAVYNNNSNVLNFNLGANNNINIANINATTANVINIEGNSLAENTLNVGNANFIPPSINEIFGTIIHIKSNQLIIKDIVFNLSGNLNYYGSLEANNSNVNISNIKGYIDNFKIVNSNMTIGAGQINMVNSAQAIEIDSGSLTLNSAIFTNASHASVVNSNGIVTLNSYNYLNSFDNIGTLNVNQGAQINTLTSNSNTNTSAAVTNLYGQVNINKTVINPNSTLNIGKGESNFTNFDQAKGASTNFFVNSVTNMGTAANHGTFNISGLVNANSLAGDNNINFNLVSSPSTNSLFNINNLDSTATVASLGIQLNSTSLLLPGAPNRFNLITIKNGDLAYTTGGFDAAYLAANNITITQNWLNPQIGMDIAADNSQTLWIEIKRLTNYKGMLSYLNDGDSTALSIATKIDNMIAANQSDQNITNIINSLDFSGSSNTIKEEQEVYIAHNSPNADFSTLKNLSSIGQNITALKPINNEIFLQSMNNSRGGALKVLNDKSKKYYAQNDYEAWVSMDFGFNDLANKNFVKGYSGSFNDFQAGVSGSLLNNLTTTGAIGFNNGKLKGSNRSYDSNISGYSLGGSATYFASYYYGTFSVMYSSSKYDNQRNIGFMNNSYSSNRDTVARSSNTLSAISSKLELGLDANLYGAIFNPNIFAGFSRISSGAIKENGSSASLAYKGFSTLVTEFGLGFNLYKDYLREEFLKQKNVKLTPIFGLNILQRSYTAPKTEFNFTHTNHNTLITDKTGEYQGVSVQSNLGLAYKKSGFTAMLAYGLDKGMGSYTNNIIKFDIKYDF
ncbi:hypothetical protein ABSA28_01011 [Candidatus Hepatincolaceae symbiont of Richtersius coronifer]